MSADRLEAPLQSIISDLERSERGRGGRGGGGGGGEARRRRRSKGTTRKSSESKREEKNQSCDCGSMLERLGAKLDAERGEIMETRLTQHDMTLTTQLDPQDVTHSPHHRRTDGTDQREPRGTWKQTRRLGGADQGGVEGGAGEDEGDPC